MAKQIIKLTEGDLHKIIENTVNKIMMTEGWEDSYRKWSKGDYKDNEEGEKLNKQWTKELKAEHPDRKSRANAVKKANTRIDVEKGKTAKDPRWRAYDKDMEGDVDEALIRRAVSETINKFKNDDMSDEEIETKIDTEANMDDFPADIHK